MNKNKGIKIIMSKGLTLLKLSNDGIRGSIYWEWSDSSVIILYPLVLKQFSAEFDSGT